MCVCEGKLRLKMFFLFLFRKKSVFLVIFASENEIDKIHDEIDYINKVGDYINNV